KSAENAGKEDVDGTSATHYPVTVDSSAISKSLSGVHPPAQPSLPAEFGYDLGVDGGDRPGQSTAEVMGSPTDTRHHAGNAASIPVEARSADQISELDFAALLGGGLPQGWPTPLHDEGGTAAKRGPPSSSSGPVETSEAQGQGAAPLALRVGLEADLVVELDRAGVAFAHAEVHAGDPALTQGVGQGLDQAPAPALPLHARVQVDVQVRGELGVLRLGRRGPLVDPVDQHVVLRA